MNSQAVLGSDRTATPRAEIRASNSGDSDQWGSVWDAKAWEGAMMWGDGHATHEPDGFVQTRVDGNTISDFNNGRGDDILSLREGPNGNKDNDLTTDIFMNDPVASKND